MDVYLALVACALHFEVILATPSSITTMLKLAIRHINLGAHLVV